MSVSKITLHIVVEKDTESGWFTASCPALPGCVTQAETEAELIDNIKEAVTLWLEVQDEKEMLARQSSPGNTSNIQELALSI
jgi:predicted RNase H-like HicB family nuclease